MPRTRSSSRSATRCRRRSTSSSSGWSDGAPVVDKTTAKFSRLRAAKLRDAWYGKPSELAGRAWLPWLEQLDAFCEAHDRFWSRFAPLPLFACDVRGRVEAELTRLRALTYDQMLSRLADRVTSAGGPDSPIAMRIRDRFDAALVDEFQDTDEAQWCVIEAAFRGRRRLFLIGDPKQAIYSFRGADVHVYLQAAHAVDPGMRQTMGENWRSDPPAVDAINALFRPDSGAFDQDDIDYVHVEPKMPERLAPTLTGLEVRWMDARLTGGSAGEPLSKKDDTLAARLVAREAVAWLEGKRARILDGERSRDVQPRDLAVLVNTNDQAQTVHEALGDAGIPSVSPSKDSVFETPVARWIGAWLDAVAGAGRDRDARAAAVTPLFGWTADELAWALSIATGGDEAVALARAGGVVDRDWNEWTERLRVASERWQRQGFARVFDREASECRVLPRVLAMPDGERHATDLRHLFELLHVEERTRRLGPGALAQWLRGQGDFFVEAHLQRLESDALAVKIETVHVSKGLQYPVVLAPYGWSARSESDTGKPIALRGKDGPELHVHVDCTEGRARARADYAAEQRREGLRKLYVALTRAQHRTTAWYGPIGNDGRKTSATPLGRILMRDARAHGFDDDAMPSFVAGDSQAWATASQRLDALAARSKGTIDWVRGAGTEGRPRLDAPRDGRRRAPRGLVARDPTCARRAVARGELHRPRRGQRGARSRREDRRRACGDGGREPADPAGRRRRGPHTPARRDLSRAAPPVARRRHALRHLGPLGPRAARLPHRQGKGRTHRPRAALERGGGGRGRQGRGGRRAGSAPPRSARHAARFRHRR